MISLNNISVVFGSRILLNDVNIRISAKDRVSFVGSNGAGKSTLLKIIAGLIPQNEGSIAVSKHTTLGYLPQEGIRLTGKSLYDEVYSGAEDLNRIKNEIEEVQREMEIAVNKSDDNYMDLLEQYSELQERFELADGFRMKSKIEKILTGLGFTENEFERMTDEFSGGWQMRIALAKLLLKSPSILLLDEPTNHLDLESLLWVENYLKNYNGAVILVSHDRSFLDNITKKTLEISLSKVTEYSGNFSFYKIEKEKRKELAESRFYNQQKYLKEQGKFIERFRYKATKARAVQSRIKLLEKIEIEEIEDDEGSIRFHFPPATHSGKISAELSDVTKSYDGKRNVLQNVNLIISRGEKIALVGNNGAGKSTLSRIIAGLEPMNNGSLKYGHMVEMKFYAQNQAEALNEEKTVLESIEESASGETGKNLRTILGSFLFSGDDVFKKVKVLSGGEKSRLALAKMLVERSNFLILDEPTNHLDMRSKDVLMNALKEYKGSVLIVSHDREFIDGIVNKVIEVRDKNLRIYSGNASEYIRMKEKELLEREMKQSNSLKSSGSSITDEIAADRNDKNSGSSLNNQNSFTPFQFAQEKKKQRREMLKVITPLKRKINSAERKLESCEIRLKELESLMASDEIYKDANKVVEINSEYKEIQKTISALVSDWESDTAKLSSLENNFKNLINI